MKTGSVAVQQLLHGNRTHLLSKQSKISGQHTNTPNLKAYIFGGIKVTSQVTSDTLAEAIKCWMLMRYLATHDPKPLNCFDKSFSLKEIIQQLRATLQQFQLHPQSTLLLFLWEKMVYTICGGETPMKKNKTTMPYMQLFKLHLIRVFSQKNLANVKKWPKNSHFRAKNHVL